MDGSPTRGPLRCREDFDRLLATATNYERSDFCQVPRAVPITEAMTAIVLADALCDKLGGDSLEEMRPRFDALRQLRIEQLPMDATPWRFGFEG